VSRVAIEPGRPYRGTVRMGGDPVISHCAMVGAALAGGESRIRNPSWGRGAVATARALRCLGVATRQVGSELVLCPPADGLTEPDDVIDCLGSATTARLLCGVAAARPFQTVLTGERFLRALDMGPLVRPLRRMGAHIDGRLDGLAMPLSVRGGGLDMVHYAMPEPSFTIKGALLLAGLQRGVAVMEPVRTPDHTERLLIRQGVTLRTTREGWLVLIPADGLSPLDLDIPADISEAALFLLAAILTPGSAVFLHGVGVNPTRSGVLEALDAMGADIQVYPVAGGVEPCADLLARHGPLVGAEIRGELAARCRAEWPLLAVAAAFAEGETVLEIPTDGGAAVSLLGELGIEAMAAEGALWIQGGRPEGPVQVEASLQPGLALACAVAGAAMRGGAGILGVQALTDRHPHLFEQLEVLRG